VTDTDPHVHHCGCGKLWICRDVWCSDECDECADKALADYLQARDFHVMQLPLPVAAEEF
jgi:predicted nucleic acid-binding Zn ribbon protein